MRVFYETIVNAVTMGGNITSSVMPLDHEALVCVQPVWTGTPTGTIKVQASLDNTTWTDISGASVATGGAAGDTLISIADVAFRYLRVVYTRTSGTGTLTVIGMAKG